jgi:hypothetical protein
LGLSNNSNEWSHRSQLFRIAVAPRHLASVARGTFVTQLSTVPVAVRSRSFSAAHVLEATVPRRHAVCSIPAP